MDDRSTPIRVEHAIQVTWFCLVLLAQIGLVIMGILVLRRKDPVCRVAILNVLMMTFLVAVTYSLL